jgi:glycosyltransferase involved in cell wall biosynthesis
MGKITVLFLDHTGFLKGGGQISLLTLLSQLDRDSFRPILLGPLSDEGFASRVEELNILVEVSPFSTLKSLNFIAIFKSLLKVFRVAKREKVDIIHANTSRAMWYGGIVGGLLQIPVIWHVRIAESDGFIDRILSWFSTRVVAISKFVAGKRFPWLSQDRLAVIYNGVDLRPFNEAKPTLRRELRLVGDDLLVGIVAQLQPKKGIEDFLTIASKIPKKHLKARFVIVGTDLTGGGYSSRLKEISRRLGLVGKVFFIGFRKDIPAIIKSLDLFVYTAIGEPFGRVIIEAMAGFVPVVAYSSGAMPEIITDGEEGILLSPGDTRMMAAAVSSLLNEKRRREEMGKKGRVKVEKMFSNERHGREIEKLYRAISGK